MSDSMPRGSDGCSDLLVELIETLEGCGIGRDEYQLYDVVDFEALDRLLISADSDIEVRFVVEDILLSVTQEDVCVLLDDRPK